MAQGRHRAGRILIGIGVMIIVTVLPLVILSRFAGGWGVPFFSFTTDRGSLCTNDLTGYHCDRLTVADIRWWGDVSLPAGTTVVTSHYRSTHNFSLDAVVEVPAADARRTYLDLRRTFGKCIPDHPSSLDTEGLTDICVMANDASDGMGGSGPMRDTLYEVGTGIRTADRVRVIALHEQSR